MVAVNYKVMIAGMLCLTIIYIALLMCEQDGTMVLSLLIGIIGLATGVMIPSPKVDKKGVLKW
jgi:hypothetical protein